MKAAHQRAQRAAGNEGDHLHAQRVDARGLGRHFVLLDRQHRQAEARTLDPVRDEQQRGHQDHPDEGRPAVVGELNVFPRLVAVDREAQFLPAHPVEDEDEQRRVGQHRQREIVAAQAERDRADDQRRDATHAESGHHPEPRRDAEHDGQQGDREGAQAEERGMAERHQAGVAREQVPAQRERGPDGNRAEDELDVRVVDRQRRGAHDGRHHADHRQRAALEDGCEHVKPVRTSGRTAPAAAAAPPPGTAGRSSRFAAGTAAPASTAAAPGRS